MAEVRQHVSEISGRRPGDFLLFGVTATELALLFHLTPTFTAVDWVYVLQHLLVLLIALTRRPPEAQDLSLPANAAVVVAYAYPYAQVLYLRWVPGNPASPTGGLVLVVLAACLSLASLLSLGRRFGVFPALRGLATKGPYRIVRHPMYLAYVLGGHRLQPAGVELWHGADGTGRVAVPALPHPCRGADTLSRCGMVCLCRPGALPPYSGALVESRRYWYALCHKVRRVFEENFVRQNGVYKLHET